MLLEIIDATNKNAGINYSTSSR